MKNLYLVLSILGFIAPNIFVAKVSYETGNFLLYADPLTTFEQMFANDIASAFAIDLFFVVFVFMIWSYIEARKYTMKNYWVTWGITFAFGLACGWPLFMYLRERAREKREAV